MAPETGLEPHPMSTESNKPKTPSSRSKSDFAKEAEKDSVGLVKEFGTFLRENKKWWLLPIVITLLLVGVLIVLGGTALAPFIYPLF